MKRYHMEAKNHVAFAETPVDPAGELWLILERRINPIFKHARIKEVIQLLPSEVPTFKVITR